MLDGAATPHPPDNPTSPNQPYSPGAERIALGTCPIGGASMAACFFCPFGHYTECHHPHDCRTANCSHYRTQTANEGGDL